MAVGGQSVEPAPNAPVAAPRTLFITNDFPLRIGGAQSYYWGLVQTLDPASVTVLAPAHPEVAAFDATHPYHVVRAGSSVLRPTPDVLARASALATEQKADLVQLGHPLPAGLLGPRLKERGLPYVVFLGGAEVTIPGAVPGIRRMLRHVLGEASMLLTVSEYTAGAARRQVPGAVPAEVLRPPLKVDDFVPVADEAEAQSFAGASASTAASSSVSAGSCRAKARTSSSMPLSSCPPSSPMCTWRSSVGAVS